MPANYGNDYFGELCNGIALDYSDQQSHELRLLAEHNAQQHRKNTFRLYHRPYFSKGKVTWRLRKEYDIREELPLSGFTLPRTRMTNGYQPKCQGFSVPFRMAGVDTTVEIDAEPMTQVVVPQYVRFDIPQRFDRDRLWFRERRENVEFRRVNPETLELDTFQDVAFSWSTDTVSEKFVAFSNSTEFLDGMADGETSFDELKTDKNGKEYRSLGQKERREEACKRWTAVRYQEARLDKSTGETLVEACIREGGKLVTTDDGRDIPDIQIEQWRLRHFRGGESRYDWDTIPQYLRSAICTHAWGGMQGQLKPGLNLFGVLLDFIEEALQTIAMRHLQVLRGVSQFNGNCPGLADVVEQFLQRYGVKNEYGDVSLDSDLANARKVNKNTLANKLNGMAASIAENFEFHSPLAKRIYGWISKGFSYKEAGQREGCGESKVTNVIKELMSFNRALRTDAE